MTPTEVGSSPVSLSNLRLKIMNLAFTLNNPRYQYFPKHKYLPESFSSDLTTKNIQEVIENEGKVFLFGNIQLEAQSLSIGNSFYIKPNLETKKILIFTYVPDNQRAIYAQGSFKKLMTNVIRVHIDINTAQYIPDPESPHQSYIRRRVIALPDSPIFDFETKSSVENYGEFLEQNFPKDLWQIRPVYIKVSDRFGNSKIENRPVYMSMYQGESLEKRLDLFRNPKTRVQAVKALGVMLFKNAIEYKYNRSFDIKPENILVFLSYESLSSPRQFRPSSPVSPIPVSPTSQNSTDQSIIFTQIDDMTPVFLGSLLTPEEEALLNSSLIRNLRKDQLSDLIASTITSIIYVLIGGNTRTRFAPELTQELFQAMIFEIKNNFSSTLLQFSATEEFKKKNIESALFIKKIESRVMRILNPTSDDYKLFARAEFISESG